MRQYAGFGTAAESNRRYRYLLEQGTTGLSVAFDLPTQIGYDSDDPHALGEVGRVGVAIDSLEDMELLFDGIPLDRVSTLDDDQRDRGDPAGALRGRRAPAGHRPSPRSSGTVQNDILKEYVARGTWIYPPGPSLRLVTDVFAYCAEHVPKWNTISISGYHIREAGATAPQEIAFTFANAIEYVRAAQSAGPRARPLRRAALVLLRLPLRFRRGGRQVPRRAPAVGADHEGALRRHEPEGPAVPRSTCRRAA